MYNVHGLEDNIVMMSVIPKLIYRFNAALRKNQQAFFLDKNWHADTKISIKMPKTYNSKKNLRKKNEVGRFTIFDSKTSPKVGACLHVWGTVRIPAWL